MKQARTGCTRADGQCQPERWIVPLGSERATSAVGSIFCAVRTGLRPAVKAGPWFSSLGRRVRTSIGVDTSLEGWLPNRERFHGASVSKRVVYPHGLLLALETGLKRVFFTTEASPGHEHASPGRNALRCLKEVG